MTLYELGKSLFDMIGHRTGPGKDDLTREEIVDLFRSGASKANDMDDSRALREFADLVDSGKIPTPRVSVAPPTRGRLVMLAARIAAAAVFCLILAVPYAWVFHAGLSDLVSVGPDGWMLNPQPENGLGGTLIAILLGGIMVSAMLTCAGLALKAAYVTLRHMP